MQRKSEMRRLTLPIEHRDYILGPQNAPVALVEYSDYECPFCAAAHPIVSSLLQALNGQVRFAVRNFPLTSIHPHAEHAAEAALAAGAQGKFWKMHDTLFENQNALSDEDLANYAAKIGLDVPRFIRELTTETYTPRVREDFLSGARSGVNGTPTFFINGVRHDGSYDLPSLLEAVQNALPE